MKIRRTTPGKCKNAGYFLQSYYIFFHISTKIILFCSFVYFCNQDPVHKLVLLKVDLKKKETLKWLVILSILPDRKAIDF